MAFQGSGSSAGNGVTAGLGGAGQLTVSTDPFVEAEQYSSFVLRNLHDGLLPSTLYRNVSDFGSGTTLNIKGVGSRALVDRNENEQTPYAAIDTRNVFLTISKNMGDAIFVTDELKEDGSQVEQLLAASKQETTRAIQEEFEIDFLSKCEDASVAAGAAHTTAGVELRFAATGGNGQMTIADLIKMKFSFDKHKVPYAGRIAIVDPVVSATFSSLVNLQSDITQFASEILINNFTRDHQALFNIHGWNIVTSNLLPTTDLGAVGNKACVFMSVLSDQHKPMMAAWRRMPTTKGEYNKDKGRDEYVTTCRWGIGHQRVDTLGIIAVHPTATA